MERKEQKLDASQKILKAALKEFSTYGLSGARMERIAKVAKVNKAMIFYYFSSKEKLYEVVIRKVFSSVYPKIIELVSLHPTAGVFLEKGVEIYVGIFTRNPDFVKMIMLELIQNPGNITSFMKELFQEMGGTPGPPFQLKEMIEKWYREGAISEGDPFQFMLNLISLSLLSFLGKPFLEVILQSPVPAEDFEKKRIKSVVNLLKRGMLS
ncbi:MAG TPA: TetR/AcrR family transcriptional regulator [Candidatus Kapabacteria bacterium]|nr:TetR/AcrR family transcriptional regulator [Candidatus Kapabacteria bacterium]